MRNCLKIFGIPYNQIIEKLKQLCFLKETEYYIREKFPEFHIFLEEVSDESYACIKRIFHPYIFGEGNETFSQSVKKEMVERGLTLATAESCTAGLIGHLITETEGCSRYYLGGFITYSNESKVKNLGVLNETIKKYGAVSSETALEMARGAKIRLTADVSVSCTGIAGPGGGSVEKPVGTVFIAVSAPQFEKVENFFFKGSRSEIKLLSAYSTLNMVRFYCIEWIKLKEGF